MKIQGKTSRSSVLYVASMAGGYRGIPGVAGSLYRLKGFFLSGSIDRVYQIVDIDTHHLGDVVQVDTWVAPSGKNGMRRDWLLRDCKTGDILTRASSVWVMMNKETRRISKLPNEVREEIGSYFVDSPPIVDEDTRKLPKLDESTADYIHTGLTPRWSDLDVNQHVNNVKYIGWIVEGAPLQILESHELCGLTLEYRRECRRDSVVQSLTAISGGGVGGLVDSGHVECQHLLRLEGGGEIVKARTEWRPKFANSFGSLQKAINS